MEWRRVVDRAEELKGREEINDVYQLLSKNYDAGMRSPQIAWRLGRAHYDVAQESTNPKEVESHCLQGLKLAQEALGQEESSGAHKWTGILLGCVGDFLPTKEKIANAYTIQSHFQRAVELDPNDSTAHHCLARWCWSMIQISWVERQAAKLLFGAPPTCSIEQCKESLLRSDSIDKAIHNQILLGDLLLKEGKKDEAKKWYESAAILPAVTKNQIRQRMEAESKLKPL